MAEAFNPSDINTVAPARHAKELTPESGAVLLPTPYCTLYVGTGGDVCVLPSRNTIPVTYKNVPGGTALNVLCKAIVWDNTTASDIIVEW